MNMFRLPPFAAALGLALLAGCSSVPARDPDFAATRPEAAPTQPVNPGAIYQPAQAISLFEDQRARRVGDILTIRLVESMSASKTASTNTKKETSADLPEPTLFGTNAQFTVPHQLPLASTRKLGLETSIDSKQQFTGQGASSQGNTLTGSISVTVAEVLGNGNLVVRGEKLFTLNQGHEHVRIAGIVRRADIAPDNSVLSTQVADAQITYAGEGALADSNQMGWLARFFNSSWWPF
jgi:flagellar L-ring protein precursor FlgH